MKIELNENELLVEKKVTISKDVYYEVLDSKRDKSAVGDLYSFHEEGMKYLCIGNNKYVIPPSWIPDIVCANKVILEDYEKIL